MSSPKRFSNILVPGLGRLDWVVGSVVVVFLGFTGLFLDKVVGLGAAVPVEKFWAAENFSWTKNFGVALCGRLWAWPSREAAGLFGGYEC